VTQAILLQSCRRSAADDVTDSAGVGVSTVCQSSEVGSCRGSECRQPRGVSIQQIGDVLGV